MKLSEFKEVHPNWDLITRMSRDELVAMVDLTTTLLALDETNPPESHSKMVHDLFDDCNQTLDAEMVQRLGWNAEERLATADRDELRNHLVDEAKTIDEESRVAAFRLLALVAFTNEPTEEQAEYLTVVGDAMDLDGSLIEDVMRAAWETRQGPVTTHVRDRSNRHSEEHGANFVWGQKY